MRERTPTLEVQDAEGKRRRYRSASNGFPFADGNTVGIDELLRLHDDFFRGHGLLQRCGVRTQDAGMAVAISLMPMNERDIGVERRDQADRLAAEGIGEVRGYSQRQDGANPYSVRWRTRRKSWSNWRSSRRETMR